MFYTNLEQAAKTQPVAEAALRAKAKTNHVCRLVILRSGNIVHIFNNDYAQMFNPANKALIAEGIWGY